MRPSQRRADCSRRLSPLGAGLLGGWLLVATAGCGSGDEGNGPTDCPDGLVDCGNGCVDLATDPSHCGSCGSPCAADEQCYAGACAAPCDDECDEAGIRECSEDGWRECGDYDLADVCLEWSNVEPCQAGFICDPATVTCTEACGDFCDPFSVVLLPDTQYYTSKLPDGPDNTYRQQMQWVIDHRDADNIQFVIHLGDVTHNNTTEQWQTASNAHAMLDAAGVHYSMAPGNHDYLSGSQFGRGQTLFDDYFPASRFDGKPWYGDSFGASNVNNYTTFELGHMRFLVLSLEYAPRKDALCWADEIIAAHPEHRVIIATHCYLTHDGNYSPGCPNPDYDAVGSPGRSVWDELASRHSNVTMVVSGHVGDSEYVPRQGHNGNVVHQLLVDYQFEAFCGASDPTACTHHCREGTYTGNGWLRLLTFYPRQSRVHAQTLTVQEGDPQVFPGGEPMLFCSELTQSANDWYDSDPAATDHDFEFDYDLMPAPPYDWDDGDELAFIDRTVNSVAAGQQIDPQVSIAPDGSFVVAWEDDSSAADGAGNHDILVRGFGPGGCEAFADVQANPDGTGQQQAPAVASDAQGNFVVVWQDDTDENGVFQLHARGFAADGTERFPRMTVNSQAQGQQVEPAIGMAPDGRFVVAWQDDPENDGTYQVMMRGFAADGSERFSQRSAHADAQGQRIAPSVGLADDARFVVAWQDDTDGNGVFQIHARGFAANGAEQFALLTVNSVATGQQRRPAVGTASDGSFVVAWEDAADGSYDIRARGFHANGTNRVSDFPVSSTSGEHRSPAVAMTPSGNFTVAWQDDADGNGSFQIAARAFAADGAERLARFIVNREGTGQQIAPASAEDDAGALVVAWQDDMDDNGVYQILARGFDAP
ncbi:MAG: metallophosphoesterase [Deltaproteobacteria bacterium]|nr:metallophosphoesterase [Deltaproteobacteria bacterium]MBW2532483.1 metallophosphoesterase [Deltaproteobacteria bacterium]